MSEHKGTQGGKSAVKKAGQGWLHWKSYFHLFQTFLYFALYPLFHSNLWKASVPAFQ